MIEFLGAIVQYGHNIRIVVLVVVVERIEEHTETVPAVRRSKDVAIVVALRRRVPKCLHTKMSTMRQNSQLECLSRWMGSSLCTNQTVGADASTTGHPEHDLHFPPIEIRHALRPDRALLAAQRRRHPDTLRTGDGICWRESKTITKD